MEKASAVDFSPGQAGRRRVSTQDTDHKSTESKRKVALTDQEVDGAAEDEGGDGAQGDVGQDLGQEVDGHPVVAADVLMSAAGNQVEISVNTLPLVVSRLGRSLSLARDLHKELSFRDEELGGRHGAETLVGGDEEQGAHPVRETVKLGSGSTKT